MVTKLADTNRQIAELNSKNTLITKLVKNLKNQLAQVSGIFSEWLSLSTVAGNFISQTQNAVSELKEIDTLLTAISRTNSKLSKSDLAAMGNRAFDTASKYGRGVTELLSKIQEASLAGYEDAEGIAELSLAAQNVGDMTAELADQMISAADNAYKMNGSVSELTKVLDGMTYIASRNAVNMSDISQAMSIAGSAAASFGVGADEAVAALAAMIAATGQSGSAAAEAFKAILSNIRQVSDAESGIDAKGLARYESACNALNVKLRETRDGVLSLRDPMEVLKELSTEYNKLAKTDRRRTNLLDSIGGELSAEQLDALLSQWNTYETMLKQYTYGTGALAAEAAKNADSWEGSLTRLSNTWTDTMGNIVNSDAVVTAVNSLNGLLSTVNHVTEALGSWGTIGLSVGLFTGIKNVGSPKMSGLKNCFEIPTVC